MSGSVPIVPRRTLETYVERIEGLRRDAAVDELGTLEYLLSIAGLEARKLVEDGERERAMRAADPDDLWRPG